MLDFTNPATIGPSALSAAAPGCACACPRDRQAGQIRLPVVTCGQVKTSLGERVDAYATVA